jgi:hypothetical protein
MVRKLPKANFSRTFVLGGIPIAFLTLLDYQRKDKLNRNQTHNIHSTQMSSKEKQTKLSIIFPQI